MHLQIKRQGENYKFFDIALVESENQRNYNNYRSNMNSNIDLKKLLAEARAIHLAMGYGQLTYEQAKLRVQPILESINHYVELIAKQHKVKPRHVKFQDLGRNL